ncbi:MAG: hypothetical protein IIA45_11290 [Bacteroidetes bacterium]|nr:hypothetical protein [Bacteroidota bacterium]
MRTTILLLALIMFGCSGNSPEEKEQIVNESSEQIHPKPADYNLITLTVYTAFEKAIMLYINMLDSTLGCRVLGSDSLAPPPPPPLPGEKVERIIIYPNEIIGLGPVEYDFLKDSIVNLLVEEDLVSRVMMGGHDGMGAELVFFSSNGTMKSCVIMNAGTLTQGKLITFSIDKLLESKLDSANITLYQSIRKYLH